MPLNAALLRLALAITVLVLGAPAAGAVTPEQPTDMVLGRATAKVTVVEYASLSCPHCAQFHKAAFPAFKAKYIDTGKVRYIYREFITEPAQVAAAGALVARCSGKARYFAVIQALFAAQPAMYRTGQAQPWLKAGAAAGGLSDTQVAACLADKAAIAALNARVEAYAERDKIASTPTLVVGGELIQGEVTLEALSAAVDPLLARPSRR